MNTKLGLSLLRLFISQLLITGVVVFAQGNVATPCNDDGGGHVVFLDRHFVTCNGLGITGTRLERCSETQYHYVSECGLTTSSGTVEMRATGFNEDGTGNSVFLDRHFLDCGDHPLTSFHLARDDSLTQMRYDYTCDMSTTLVDYVWKDTDWKQDCGGNTVCFDQHYMACPEGSVLTAFGLVRGSQNSIRFNYKCGYVQSHCDACGAQCTSVEGCNDLHSGWTCVGDISAPVRVTDNDVECYSLDGVNCQWHTCPTLPPNDGTPLRCGQMHQDIYGGPGYEDENHWCSKAQDNMCQDRVEISRCTEGQYGLSNQLTIDQVKCLAKRAESVRFQDLDDGDFWTQSHANSYPIESISGGWAPDTVGASLYGKAAPDTSAWFGPASIHMQVYDCVFQNPIDAVAYWACGNSGGLHMGVSACGWDHDVSLHGNTISVQLVFGRDPINFGIIQTDKLYKVYDDSGSGAHSDLSIWAPVVWEIPGYYPIGVAASSQKHVPPNSVLVATGVVGEDLARPVDFWMRYEDSGSGADVDFSFWTPICPAGFQPLGGWSHVGHHKPPLHAMYCVNSNHAIQTYLGGKIYDDGGSGADMDGSVWEIFGSPMVWFNSEKYAPGDSVFRPRNYAKQPDIHGVMNRYGPRLYSNYDESFQPSNVDHFLTVTDLCTVNSCQTLSETSLPLSAPPSNTDVWLQLKNENERAGNIAIAKAYVHTMPEPVSRTYSDIQVWVFYPYNGDGEVMADACSPDAGWFPCVEFFDETVEVPMGHHEGDFEHVTMRIDKTSGELVEVYYSAHSGGTWYRKGDLEFELGEHFRIFAAKNGHAFYPHQGDFRSAAERYSNGVFRVDYGVINRCNAGSSFLTSDNWENVDETSPSWLAFNGRWGKVEAEGDAKGHFVDAIKDWFPGDIEFLGEEIGGELWDGLNSDDFAAGPEGPLMKSGWTETEVNEKILLLRAVPDEKLHVEQAKPKDVSFINHTWISGAMLGGVFIIFTGAFIYLRRKKEAYDTVPSSSGL